MQIAHTGKDNPNCTYMMIDSLYQLLHSITSVGITAKNIFEISSLILKRQLKRQLEQKKN